MTILWFGTMIRGVVGEVGEGSLDLDKCGKNRDSEDSPNIDERFSEVGDTGILVSTGGGGVLRAGLCIDGGVLYVGLCTGGGGVLHVGHFIVSGTIVIGCVGVVTSWSRLLACEISSIVGAIDKGDYISTLDSVKHSLIMFYRGSLTGKGF